MKYAAMPDSGGALLPPPAPAQPVASPLPSSEDPPSLSEPLPEDVEYFETDERFVIAFDVGNTSTSITLTHLAWGSRPLSPSSSTLRTVLTYPFSTPALTPVPSRTPSLIAYDRDDRPRAFGAECLTDGGRRHARDEGWIIVKGWKEQVKPPAPAPAVPLNKQPEDAGKKLLKRLRPPLASSATAHLAPPASPAAASFRPLASAGNSLWSLSSEGLLDAVDAQTAAHPEARSSTPSGALSGLDGGSGALGDLGRGIARAKEREKDRPKAQQQQKVHHGPRLRSIYADYLKWVVASARAWFAESTPGGDEVFVRCWEGARFVFAIPADWGAPETEFVRGAMEEARLLPSHFEVGRLTFVKEPAAITYFARRHTKDSDKWLRAGESFALVDAAESGVSIIGYTVSQASPRLKLRAYEPVSRLPAGAGAVLVALSTLLTTRLARTKFKSPSILSYLLDEFRAKVLPRFAGSRGEKDEYRLRIVPEGRGDGKVERAVDSGARVKEGWLTLSGQDVEGCFRPAVDAIIVRLSSILPRGEAKHILLSGGFAESPYLVARLRETFEPHGVRLVIPDIPTHAAVSEGALRFYLSETLSPRRTRAALGVQVAVDWAASWEKGMEQREMFHGSGGRRLVLGKWGEVVPAGAPLARATTWRKTFNFRYRHAAQDPTFKTQLWRYDAAAEELQDGWMVGPDGKTRSPYSQVCEVKADLVALVAESKLVVYIGEETLEAAVEWQEGEKTVRGPASRLPQETF
ncbi:hypothetical protein JCM10450v2_007013 [Rhodotorula kratochvilovae]